MSFEVCRLVLDRPSQLGQHGLVYLAETVGGGPPRVVAEGRFEMGSAPAGQELRTSSVNWDCPLSQRLSAAPIFIAPSVIPPRTARVRAPVAARGGRVDAAQHHRGAARTALRLSA
jgi:hypothetical protein